MVSFQDTIIEEGALESMQTENEAEMLDMQNPDAYSSLVSKEIEQSLFADKQLKILIVDDEPYNQDAV